MIPTLDTGGYKAEVKMRKNGREYGSIAVHCYIGHLLGEDCIRFLMPPHKGDSPLVNGHNVYKVLEHEGLHCILQDMGIDYEGRHGKTDGLDYLIDSLPPFSWVRLRLAFRIPKEFL